MAGLARAQQLFTRGIIGTLAALVGFARGDAAGVQAAASKGLGHPIHAKYLRSKLDGCPGGFHLRHRPTCTHYKG